MNFNQKLAVPGFIDKSGTGGTDAATGRRMVALSEINVARDIMGVSFQQTSDTDEAASFYLEMKDWTEDGMQIHMNHADPLAVSSGSNGDGVQISLKNTNLFVSQATGMPLSKEKAALPSSEVPRQLPKGISEDSIAIQAKVAFIGMTSVFIIQFGLMHYLKGSIQTLMTLYFTLQLICYLELFGIAIPSNA